MLTEPELRDFRRMNQQAPMRFRLGGEGAWQPAELADLSASGLAMRVATSLPVGTRLWVEVAPELALVPPLTATVEVMRIERDAAGLLLGCRFLEMN